MRELLRRLLWLLPTLVVVTALAFWSLSGTLGSSEADSVTLPMFFNPAPRGVRELSWEAASAVARDAAGAPAAAATLSEIGGAGLPHVLPRLDALSPAGRQELALALNPVAVRMGNLSPNQLQSPQAALEFWTRFSEERLMDFNPAAARRAVARYVERSSALREQELRQLDTFALEETIAALDVLVGKLSLANSAESLSAARRLSLAAAHATGRPWIVPESASPEQAREINGSWQRFWARNKSRFVNLVGVERLLAPVLQTRYAAWASEAVRSRFGVMANGQSVLHALRQRGPLSLGLFCAGLFGGTLLGILVGQASTTLAPVIAARVRWASVVFAALLAALLLWHDSPAARSAAATLGMLLMGGLLVVRHQEASSQLPRRTAWVRAYRAIGASPLRIAWCTLRASSNLSIGALAPHTSTLLTAVFVLEYALHLQGLGPLTIAALLGHELDWVMLITGGCTLLVGLVQLASDALLARLDPSSRSSTRGRDA
jgi:ABC-type dipeptide/oligopeptide/nickel transport system permease component